MFEDFIESMREQYNFYRNSTTFVGATTDHIRDHYEHAHGESHEKEAQMYALQLAVDAFADDEISRDEYQEVEDSARDHVENFFFDGENDTELVLPDTGKTTKQFLLHQNNDMLNDFKGRMADYDGRPDRVVGVASGGMEPGMIAALELDTDYSTVRMSRWRKGDEEVYDLGGDYEGEDVLLVEDKDGETMRMVEEYMRDQGVNSLDSRAVFE